MIFLKRGLKKPADSSRTILHHYVSKNEHYAGWMQAYSRTMSNFVNLDL